MAQNCRFLADVWKAYEPAVSARIEMVRKTLAFLWIVSQMFYTKTVIYQDRLGTSIRLPRQARDKHAEKLKTQNSSACRFCSGEDGSTGSLQYFDEDFEEWTALVAVRFHANSFFT